MTTYVCILCSIGLITIAAYDQVCGWLDRQNTIRIDHGFLCRLCLNGMVKND